ncbi:MAG: Bax inhibitor-1/YccA family protein [Planctomycetota bacterium]
MFRTSNPALKAFDTDNLGVARYEELSDGGAMAADSTAPAKTMTVAGTISASAVLLGICSVVGVGMWSYFNSQAGTEGLGGNMFIWLIGSLIGTLALGLVIGFKPKTAPWLSPVFAAGEGVMLAALTIFITSRWLGDGSGPAATGLIFQAVVVTFGIFAGVLAGYATGILKAGPVFQKIIIAGTMGLMLYVLAIWIGNGIFGLGIPNLYASASPIGIGFTVVCVVLASMNLVLDFEMIKQGVKTGAPRYMEWYGAFGLLVTLVWLYIEVLRLLAKLRSND